MDIWDADKLLLFLAFVIPGFVSIKTYELLFPGVQQDSSKQIVDAIAYSSFNYALLIWPIMLVESSKWKTDYPTTWYAGFYTTVLFVFPVALSLAWGKIRTSSWFQSVAVHPTQKPWDYVFSKRQWYWVKVILKDGTKLGGKYGDRSFSSSAPANEQIYLEESWVINQDGGLEMPKDQTAGIIVLSSEIAYIELYKYWEDSTNERTEATMGRVSTHTEGS